MRFSSRSTLFLLLFSLALVGLLILVGLLRGADTSPFATRPSFSVTKGTTGLPHLVENFKGLDSIDSFKVNGYPSEPPQQGLCVNGDFVVEIIDLVVGFYHRDGTLLSHPVGMNQFFGETPGLSGELVDDPRCYFDPSTHTWFATAFAADPSLRASHLDIAVNPTNSPLNPWKVFHIDTTDPQAKGCPCFADGPFFGIDQYNIYLSANEYNLTALGGGQQVFHGAEVYAVAKSPLVTLSGVKDVRFGNLSVAGGLAKTVSPTISYGNPDAAYFISSFAQVPSDHRLSTWAMTNREAVATGGMPKLSTITIDTEPYGQPPPGKTPNTFVLNAHGDRVWPVRYINGQLWATLDTILPAPKEKTPRSGPAWFEIHPQLSSDNQVIRSAQMIDQGYISSPGSDLLTPQIQPGPDGHVVMVMSLSGPHVFPGVVYAVRAEAAHAQFGTIQPGAAGMQNIDDSTCYPKNGGVCEWGAYAEAVLDASTNGKTIWTAGEYIPGPGNHQQNWGTRILEIQIKM